LKRSVANRRHGCELHILTINSTWRDPIPVELGPLPDRGDGVAMAAEILPKPRILDPHSSPKKSSSNRLNSTVR
jgi:hypothetical protein